LFAHLEAFDLAIAPPLRTVAVLMRDLAQQLDDANTMLEFRALRKRRNRGGGLARYGLRKPVPATITKPGVVIRL
jgi:hypothetical protein